MSLVPFCVQRYLFACSATRAWARCTPSSSAHRLFVGVHAQPRLAVFDTGSGRLVAALASVQDSDDLYFDAERKRVYMPGGEGFIAVFQMTDPDHYQLLDRIPTAIGAKTARYYGKQGKGFDRFYLAVPARGGQSAEVRIYRVQD